MFTGIIEHVGTVAGVTPTAAGLRLLVDPCGWGYVAGDGAGLRMAVGDSIAVGGCCLTVAEGVEKTGRGSGGLLAFDVVPETLSKTNLGEFVVGRRVNLEHAATASTLMGGHVVQGHVDGVGRVEKNEKRKAIQREIGEEGGGTGDDGWVLRVAVSRELAAYMVPKGSVALDGVSLTIAAVGGGERSSEAAQQRGRDEWYIEIALIPTTLAKTTLGELKPGDSINVEADVMAKTVVHYLTHFGKMPADRG